MKRKHAELPGEPAANNSVLLTTKVRDRDKGTENGEKQHETVSKGEKGDLCNQGTGVDRYVFYQYKYSIPEMQKPVTLCKQQDKHSFAGRRLQGG